MRKRRERGLKKCKAEYISVILIKLFDTYKVAVSSQGFIKFKLKMDNYKIICFKLPILGDTI